MSNLEKLIKTTMALGDHTLVAYIKDMDTLMKVMSQLPYVKLDPPDVAPRAGTGARAVKVIRDDNTEWLVLVTGGDLTPAEAQTAMALLTKYGENQTFAGPGIGDSPSRKKPWWRFW